MVIVENVSDNGGGWQVVSVEQLSSFSSSLRQSNKSRKTYSVLSVAAGLVSEILTVEMLT